MYEFVKYGKNYLVKNSNGRIVSEKEKIQMENKELILKDITGCGCQKETTKKLSANKKRLKELEKENVKINVDLQPIDSKRVVKYIKEQKDDVNDIIQETTKTL